MKKIEFDRVYGIRRVYCFDSEAQVIGEVDSAEDAFCYLDTAGDGLYGLILTDDQYEAVKEEYGVQNDRR